jgi:transmembrane sensor
MKRPPSSPRPSPPPSTARREASVWLARLERGLRADEGTGLRQWMQSRENRDAILETANLWHGPEVYRLLLGLTPPDLSKARREAWRRTSRRTFTTLGIISSVVLSFTLMSGQMPWQWLDEPGPNPRAAPNEYFRTAVGQTRTVTLRDGSRITLNTGTRVEVTYLPERREVFLAQGEASFDVAPDTGRPFYVFAARRQFEAIGTKFNVRAISPENAELTVTEGEVKVLDAPPKIPTSPARRRDAITYGEATVGVSETALVEPGFQFITHIDRTEVEQRLAWQRGILVFEDRALEDVLSEMERYTHVRFVLRDPALSTIRVTGIVRIGDVGALRRTLRKQFAIFSRPDTRGRVVLMPLPQVPSREL